MIGIIASWVSNFRILLPIIDELNRLDEEYILYYRYKPSWRDKENSFVFLTDLKINKMSEDIIGRAKKVERFGSIDDLHKRFKEDGISKLIGVEIGHIAERFKKVGYTQTNTYSVSYLTDSVWGPAEKINSPTRVYYATEYIMKFQHNLLGVKYDQERDRCLGSPLFDYRHKFNIEKKDVTLLLPSEGQKKLTEAFVKLERYRMIIERIVENAKDNDYLIFKTRPKHCIPYGILDMADEVIIDNAPLYSKNVPDCFDRSFCTIMFGSTGIFEAVLAGNYIINIPINWDLRGTNRFFSLERGNMYNFPGVSRVIPVKPIFKRKVKVRPQRIDPDAQKEWIAKFVGDIPDNCTKAIVSDILSH